MFIYIFPSTVYLMFSLIQNVAEQTNFLALNAAVTAAMNEQRPSASGISRSIQVQDASAETKYLRKVIELFLRDKRAA